MLTYETLAKVSDEAPAVDAARQHATSTLQVQCGSSQAMPPVEMPQASASAAAATAAAAAAANERAAAGGGGAASREQQLEAEVQRLRAQLAEATAFDAGASVLAVAELPTDSCDAFPQQGTQFTCFSSAKKYKY